MPNRYVCSVLDEMRKAYEIRQYVLIPGLLEEIQTAVNRMEAALGDQYDTNRLREEKSELKQEVKKLEAKVAKLKKQAGEKPKKKRSGRL